MHDGLRILILLTFHTTTIVGMSTKLIVESVDSNVGIARTRNI